MLLLFILIGVLAIGLPLMLMLFGDPPAPPPPPVVKAKPAIVQPAPVADPVAVPQVGGSETAPPSMTESSQPAQAAVSTSTTSAPAVPPAASAEKATTISNPAVAAKGPSEAEMRKELQKLLGDKPLPQLPGDAAKLPSEAELMKEMKRLLDERAKAGL